MLIHRKNHLFKFCILRKQRILDHLDKLFLVSVSMSDLRNIVFQKGIHQSGKSLLSFPSWKISPKSERSFSEVGIVCLESGACLCTVGGNLPQIWGKFFRGRNYLPWIWGTFLHGGGKSAPNLREVFPRSELFALNLRHVYAQGVESSPESEARFSDVGMISPRSGADKWGSKMVCPESGAIYPT